MFDHFSLEGVNIIKKLEQPLFKHKRAVETTQQTQLPILSS